MTPLRCVKLDVPKVRKSGCLLTGSLGKGVVTLLSKVNGLDMFDARIVTMTVIYSAVGIRNEALNNRLRDTFTRGGWPTFKRLRRDPHEPSASCWLHGDSFCFTA
jgi:protein-L-isoaspartate(D-aspartate) O-methyltransferase